MMQLLHKTYSKTRKHHRHEALESLHCGCGRVSNKLGQQSSWSLQSVGLGAHHCVAVSSGFVSSQNLQLRLQCSAILAYVQLKRD